MFDARNPSTGGRNAGIRLRGQATVVNSSGFCSTRGMCCLVQFPVRW